MPPVPIARLLAAATRMTIESLHGELAGLGHGDLRPAHGYALNAVGEQGTTTARLAADLGMTKQGAAKLVATLVRDGYLARSEHAGDARARLLTLTPRGRELLASAERIQRELEARWAHAAGPEDVAALRRALEVVVDERFGAGPPPLRPIW
jgi:DNA-binding MarR family transcriptional regulator